MSVERAKLVKEIAKIAGAETAKEVNQSFFTIYKITRKSVRHFKWTNVFFSA